MCIRSPLVKCIPFHGKCSKNKRTYGKNNTRELERTRRCKEKLFGAHTDTHSRTDIRNGMIFFANSQFSSPVRYLYTDPCMFSVAVMSVMSAYSFIRSHACTLWCECSLCFNTTGRCASHPFIFSPDKILLPTAICGSFFSFFELCTDHNFACVLLREIWEW